MHHLIAFPAARYPLSLNVRVPRGVPEEVKAAAARQNVSMGEFLRRAITRELQTAIPGGAAVVLPHRPGEDR